MRTITKCYLTSVGEPKCPEVWFRLEIMISKQCKWNQVFLLKKKRIHQQNQFVHSVHGYCLHTSPCIHTLAKYTPTPNLNEPCTCGQLTSNSSNTSTSRADNTAHFHSNKTDKITLQCDRAEIQTAIPEKPCTQHSGNMIRIYTPRYWNMILDVLALQVGQSTNWSITFGINHNATAY